jgi:hypothetical protein
VASTAVEANKQKRKAKRGKASEKQKQGKERATRVLPSTVASTAVEANKQKRESEKGARKARGRRGRERGGRKKEAPAGVGPTGAYVFPSANSVN